MKISLVAITWAYSNEFDIQNTFLYKSFKKHNEENNFIHIHFNREHYKDLENYYQENFGFQYEFLLYKVHLLIDKIKELDSEYIIVSDVNDVTCLASINDLPKHFNLDKYVVFGREKNMWPTPEAKTPWPLDADYDEWHKNNKVFLNAGVLLAKKELYIELLESLMTNVLSIVKTSFKNIVGDQGAYTYYYNKNYYPQIALDAASIFVVNSYSRSLNEFKLKNNKLVSSEIEISPYFLHDNGWNHGSPRYHDYFNLKQVYSE